ncbi:Transducin [Giardia muris]|uniref:Transducin n=1 Tax=Giardia muris TaxID=5742 RepID=A0A4Z1T1A2_GIAMU|nr:Transducin [Giardia muris]|eukprot:TNJ26309.1 Transducin [Giardia muris]
MEESVSDSELYRHVFGNTYRENIIVPNEEPKEADLKAEGKEEDSEITSTDSFFRDSDEASEDEQLLRAEKGQGHTWARSKEGDDLGFVDDFNEDDINLQEPRRKRAIGMDDLHLEKGMELTAADTPMGFTLNVDLHPIGKLAVVTSSDRRVRLFEIGERSNSLIQCLFFQQLRPQKAFFCGRAIVVVGHSRFYHIFDLHTAADIKRTSPNIEKPDKDRALEISKVGKSLAPRTLANAVAGWDGKLIFFTEDVRCKNTQNLRSKLVYGLELETNAYAYRIPHGLQRADFLCYIDAGHGGMNLLTNPLLVVAGTTHGRISLIEFDSHNNYRSLPPILFGDDAASITALATSPTLIAVGDDVGFITVYRVADVMSTKPVEGFRRVKPAFMIKNLVDQIETLTFNPTGEILVAATTHGETRFINTHFGRVFDITKPPRNLVGCTFIPDSSLMYTTVRGGRVETYMLPFYERKRALLASK